MIANLMGGDGLIVLVVALVVLVGGSQLPKIARNVGLAGREFRKAQQEAEEEHGRDHVAKASAAAPPAPLPAPAAVLGGSTPGAQAQAPAEGTITLTAAQLDALLKSKEEQVRGESPNN